MKKIAAGFVAYFLFCLLFSLGLIGFVVWAIFQIVTNL